MSGQVSSRVEAETTELKNTNEILMLELQQKEKELAKASKINNKGVLIIGVGCPDRVTFMRGVLILGVTSYEGRWGKGAVGVSPSNDSTPYLGDHTPLIH